MAKAGWRCLSCISSEGAQGLPDGPCAGPAYAQRMPGWRSWLLPPPTSPSLSSTSISYGKKATCQWFHWPIVKCSIPPLSQSSSSSWGPTVPLILYSAVACVLGDWGGWPDHRGPGCSRKDAPKLKAINKDGYPWSCAPETEKWGGPEGAGEELGWGQVGEAEAQPTRCSEGAWSWWQALLPPMAFTLAPVAWTPFYEVICVVSIERRLLNTSTHFVLARKQVFTADLFKAKIRS